MLLSRLKVIGPAFAAGTAVSFTLATKVGADPIGFLLVGGLPLAGPFAGLWASGRWGVMDALGVQFLRYLPSSVIQLGRIR